MELYFITLLYRFRHAIILTSFIFYLQILRTTSRQYGNPTVSELAANFVRLNPTLGV